MASRREFLAAGAAIVTLPMISTALGQLRQASAAAPAGRGTAPATAPDEKAGWFTTKLKAADVKENEFTEVEGHLIVVARVGKDITAYTNKCTHKGVKMLPKAGQKLITCTAHGSQFNLDGTVAKKPAAASLAQYAIRVNADGLLEIDPGTNPKKEDKEFKVTLA